MDVKLDRICPNCKKEIVYFCYKSFWSASKRNSICKSCRTTIANKSSLRNSSRENNSQWKGYKDIPFNWFSKYFLRGRKKRTGTINIEQIYDLWIKQDKKCALSNQDINFYDDGNGHTCSIDRIDSSKEYVLDNIQLVHKDVNLMKNSFNQDYFIKICKLISNNNK